MTDANKRRSALPQDPLAWMDLPVVQESDAPEPTVVTDTQQVPLAQETVGNDETETSVAATEVVSEPTPLDEAQPETVTAQKATDDEDGGFGFFANEEAAVESTESPVDDEEGGFGFFANESVDDNVNSPADDEDGGFGFFANQSNNEEATVNTQTPADDDDGGFGFFANQAVPEGAIDLEGSLTIKNVEEWHKRLGECLANEDTVKLHAEDLNQIDGCGLQLLACIFASAREKGVAVEWTSASERLRASASYFGVQQQLNLGDEQQKAA